MSARTTYSDLTTHAARELARCLHLVQVNESDSRPNPSHALSGAIEAHRDLSAALAHLGRVLSLPPGGAGNGARRAAPEARLVRDLEQRSAARDWTQPRPDEGSAAGSLWRASRLIRAAADLWTTHHTPGGAPRSPEASRMRHPSVLGAATRQWRELVVVAGAVADQLVALVPPADPGDSSNVLAAGGAPSQAPACSEPLAALRQYPRPTPRPAAEDGRLVELTVARPSPRGEGDPLADALAQIDQVHRIMWLLAESGSAPAPILANVAAIGVALAQAAEAAHIRAGGAAEPDGEREGHLEAAAQASRYRSLWQAAATHIEPLRTPHPATSAVQLHRAELTRELARLASVPAEELVPTARALSRACRDYCDLAELGQRALRTAHERGELHLLGRALPNEALTRRPDLLHAKLTGQVVPAPTVAVRRIEAAYRAIVRDRSGATAGGGSSPAA